MDRKETREEEIRNIGVDLIDKHFPKGECKERGKAIVLYAEIVIRILDREQLLLDELKKIKQERKQLLKLTKGKR